jgi:hypothetical protein
LSPEVKSQWGSSLSLAYHWKKHKSDFDNDNITLEQYAKDFANSIFQQQNVTSTGFTQSGEKRICNATNFGASTHVGFSQNRLFCFLILNFDAVTILLVDQ